MHKTLCYSLISLEKLTNTNKKTTIMLSTSKEIHFSTMLSKKLWSINMFFEEHKDNTQKTVINKIQNGMHMHI